MRNLDFGARHRTYDGNTQKFNASASEFSLKDRRKASEAAEAEKKPRTR